MVWFKVDDNFADHPKVRRIPRSQRAAAIGLWTLAGTWCARHLTDGELPDYMLDELASKISYADALVTADLWHVAGHGCCDCPPVAAGFYLYHDWTQAQPTKEEVEAERAAARERQRKARERAKSQRESQRDDGVTSDLSQPPVPDPTRPGPLSGSSEGERQVTLRAVPASEPTCSQHPLGDGGTACGGCRRVREYRDKAEAEAKEAARRARENCKRCGGAVWLDDGTKCDHRRTA